MTRLLTLAAALCLLAAAPPRAAAQAQPWGADLSPWVGNFPTREEAGLKRKILLVPAVRRSLSALLSRADLRLLDSTFAAEKEVVQIEQFVVVGQCLPHNCPSAHALVVLDTRARRLWVGLYDRTGEKVSTRWYGPTDHVLLPPAVLEKFRRGHTAE